MPMDRRDGLKPHQQLILDRAAATEDVLVRGYVETFDRNDVNELKTVVLDENRRESDRKGALERLNLWADQGSKFASAALQEMGIGGRAVMSDREFEKSLANMRLDDRSRARVRALGKTFFQYTSSLASGRTAEDRMNLDDFAKRSGPEIAERLVAHANDAAIESVNREFTLSNPDYFLCDENFDALVDCLAIRYLGYGTGDEDNATELMNNLFCDGRWTAENLQAAYEELNAAGLLRVAPGKAKPLSGDDRQALSIAAAAITTERDLSRVLDAYLKFSLGEEAPKSWRQVVGQVQFAAVLFSAVMFAWSHKRADYEPSEGSEQYIRKYLAGRFPTFGLLDAAWNKCLNETNGRGILAPEDEIVQEESAQENADLDYINKRFTVGR